MRDDGSDPEVHVLCRCQCLLRESWISLPSVGDSEGSWLPCLESETDTEGWPTEKIVRSPWRAKAALAESVRLLRWWEEVEEEWRTLTVAAWGAER